MINTTILSARIWLLTSIIFAIGIMVYCIAFKNSENALLFLFVGFLCSVLGSFPALIAFFIALPILKNLRIERQAKILWFMVLVLCIDLCYSLFPAFMGLNLFDKEGKPGFDFLPTLLMYIVILFTCTMIAVLFSLQQLSFYLSDTIPKTSNYSTIIQQLFHLKTHPKTHNMDYQTNAPTQPQHAATKNSNKILIKGLITGGLILLMLVPTLFINNLINERENRQKEVVKEVSSKWATAQTLSAPFITVPYTETFINSEGKMVQSKTQLILLADKLLVNGKVMPEERPRSIYKVLLYRTALNFSGSFKPSWPADINTANIDFYNAKLCFSLSDFKGIEEEIMVDFNNQKLMLDPGLPVNDLGDVGLSVPINISADTMKAGLKFNMDLKLKGSEQLHFIPMSVNSKFSLSSAWANPSFDGNSLPTQRSVNDSGFYAKWNFNRANLSFGTVVKTGALKTGSTAFGVSLVQPADQYNKTTRSIKYAILLIGLTFALFFIIELMQKNPLHPVQYVLVGLALVIFYTLLLSISEYIFFDYAYLTAATATVT
ncbi:MAG: cell envelope integrity protein CreD, partial [Ferruginibacter sp.]|nr:cell envelope integrity protein CreD [Ferruginibacter sp.]